MIDPATAEPVDEALHNWIENKVDERDIKKPSHYYNEEGVECKDIIRDILGHDGYMDYCRGAAIKYLFRYKDKENPIKDLGKAKQYISMMMEELQECQVKK